MKSIRSIVPIACLMYPCFLFANAESVEVLQPVESPSGLAVVTDTASTHVVSESGQAQQIPLRGSETLTNFVELKTGWIGAGFSQTSERNRLVFYSDGAGGIERIREPNVESKSELGSFRPTLLVKDQQL